MAAFAGCTGPLFYNQGQNGQWAREFLSDDRYSRLVVEIDFEEGARPESSTVQRLQQTLEKYLKKPGGIEVRESADIQGKGQGAKYSFSEIRDTLEDDARDHYKGDDTAVLYVMFVNGGSDSDGDNRMVLGAAYSGSSVVMFKDNIRQVRQNCFSLVGLTCPSVGTIEDAVTTHEVGHILGLVNNGIEMQNDRDDPESPGHSTNRNSVMYKSVPTGNIIEFVRNGNRIPNEFDADDRADMKAAGGK